MSQTAFWNADTYFKKEVCSGMAFLVSGPSCLGATFITQYKMYRVTNQYDLKFGYIPPLRPPPKITHLRWRQVISYLISLLLESRGRENDAKRIINRWQNFGWRVIVVLMCWKTTKLWTCWRWTWFYLKIPKGNAWKSLWEQVRELGVGKVSLNHGW